MFRLKTDTVNRKTIVLPFQTKIQTVREKFALFLWLNIGKLKSEYVKELSTQHDRSYWRLRNHSGAPCFITLRVYYNAQHLEVDMCGMDEDSDLVSKVFGTITAILFTEHNILTDEVVELYIMPEIMNDPAAPRFTSPIPMPTAKPRVMISNPLPLLHEHGTPTSFSEIESCPTDYRLSSLDYVSFMNFRCRIREDYIDTRRAIDAFLNQHVGDRFPDAKVSDVMDGFPNSPLYDSCEFMGSMSNNNVSVWSLRLCDIPEEDNYDNLKSTHIRVFLHRCVDYPMVEVRELRGRHSKFYHFFHLMEMKFSGTSGLVPVPKKTEEELTLERRLRQAAR